MAEKKNSEELIKIPVKWIILIVVLIAVVALFFIVGIPGTGSSVSEDEARQNLMNFFATQVPESVVQIVSSSKQEGFYEFIVNVDGQEVPVYVTLDGKYLIIDRIPLT